MASMERRRRLLFIILSFGLFPMSMSAALGDDSRPQTRRKSLVSPLKDSRVAEVGVPEDIAWQAWLLDSQRGDNAGGGLDSASLLRRITPKSIFIAPSYQALPACAEGYEADSMNRCVKTVNINPNAHLDFLVERLNAMYQDLENRDPGASSSSGSVPTGPLQLDLLNIPVIVEPEDQTDEDEDSDESPSTSLPSSEDDKTQGEDDKIQAGGMEPVADDEKHEDGESDQKFFHGPQTTKDGSEKDESNSEKYEGVVPIVDFVDDTNSSYSEVIDYKVENDEKLHNHTTSDQIAESKFPGDDKREHLRDKKPLNESSLAPTVVLLLAPTKLPVSNVDLIVAHNRSTGKLSVRRDDRENGTAIEEIITVNLTEHLATASPPILLFFNASTSDDRLSSTSRPQSTSPEEPEDTETDEPDETETEFPGENDKRSEDIEESTESDDEILTHSEAGLTVTIPPRLQQSSTPVDDKDTTSRISSEVSINDDFVRETTLLGLNLHKDSNSTTNFSRPEDQTSTLLDDEKIITVTPEMVPEQETTSFHEDVSSFTEAPENAETTEDEFDGRKEFTTQTITKQPELPVTTRIYESFSTDRREVNPVIKIEEITYDGSTNGEPSTENPLASSQTPEDLDNSEIMTASSSNNAEEILHHDALKKIHAPINTNTRKRVGPHADGADIKYVTSTLSESPDVYTEIRTIYDKDAQKVSESENVFPNQRKVPPVPAKEFVRFPTWDKVRNRLGYVRFPSEQANSIHTPDDFKDNLHHRPYNQQFHRGSMKNRSRPQKVSWPSWGNDRRSIRSRSGANDKPKDRFPMWFWTRMPLLKDPSLPQQPSNPSDGSTGAGSINYYEEMSSHDVPRAFARSAPISG